MQQLSITIKDIARALDLSYSTVSRSLKNSHLISEATRKRVREYAEANHYRPNLIAQSLKNKRTRCIGVVLCNIPNSFFGEVISGIESVTYHQDYLLIVMQNLESYEREVNNLEKLCRKSVDGLLISLSSETKDISHFRKVHEQGLPMIFLDRVTDEINTHRIIADNTGGAYKATKHLIEEGYRNIAQITSAPHLSITRERLAGYQQALVEKKIPVNNKYIKHCLHGGMLVEEIEQAIDELIMLKTPPDAILTASDRISLRSFALLRKKGFAIPGDIGLAGFSNFSAPELFSPSLTTVRLPAFEMGKVAAEKLIELIESKTPVTEFQKTVLSSELLIRESSRKK